MNRKAGKLKWSITIFYNVQFALRVLAWFYDENKNYIRVWGNGRPMIKFIGNIKPWQVLTHGS